MRLVVRNVADLAPAFLVQVFGNSFYDFGICDGDILLVERLAVRLVGANPLVVRSGLTGLVIERANGHNGFHGVVTEIMRRAEVQ
jgi:hypothetical protein